MFWTAFFGFFPVDDDKLLFCALFNIAKSVSEIIDLTFYIKYCLSARHKFHIKPVLFS